MARKIKLERSLFISLSSHSVRIYVTFRRSEQYGFTRILHLHTIKSRVGRRRGRRCFPAKVLYLKAVKTYFMCASPPSRPQGASPTAHISSIGKKCGAPHLTARNRESV